RFGTRLAHLAATTLDGSCTQALLVLMAWRLCSKSALPDWGRHQPLSKFEPAAIPESQETCSSVAPCVGVVKICRERAKGVVENAVYRCKSNICLRNSNRKQSNNMAMSILT